MENNAIIDKFNKQHKKQVGEIMQNIENKYFIDEEKFNCPFCQNKGLKYVVLGIAQFDEKNDKKLHAVFVECSHCHKVSMHLMKNINLPMNNFEILNDNCCEHKTYCKQTYNSYIKNKLSFYYDNEDVKNTTCVDENIILSIPTSFFTIDDRIPKKLRELINEAEKCVQNNCITGASACIRKTIYEFLLIANAQGNSYEEKIKSLKNIYKTVENEYMDILSKIQGIMCDQVHENTIYNNFKTNEAKAYIELLKEIFNQVYVIPDELKKKKSKIDELFGSLKR